MGGLHLAFPLRRRQLWSPGSKGVPPRSRPVRPGSCRNRACPLPGQLGRCPPPPGPLAAHLDLGDDHQPGSTAAPTREMHTGVGGGDWRQTAPGLRGTVWPGTSTDGQGGPTHPCLVWKNAFSCSKKCLRQIPLLQPPKTGPPQELEVQPRFSGSNFGRSPPKLSFCLGSFSAPPAASFGVRGCTQITLKAD